MKARNMINIEDPKIQLEIQDEWTPARFAECVEYTKQDSDCGYIEAVTIVCDKYELDIERTAKILLSAPLRERIEAEAQSRNLLKIKSTKGSTLIDW